jgi:hypothetical protein
MTDKQPEALLYADILANKIPSIECLEKAAAELRRLHEVNVMLIDALRFCSGTSYITDAHEIAEEALAEAEGKNT